MPLSGPSTASSSGQTSPPNCGRHTAPTDISVYQPTLTSSLAMSLLTTSSKDSLPKRDSRSAGPADVRVDGGRLGNVLGLGARRHRPHEGAHHRVLELQTRADVAGLDD